MHFKLRTMDNRVVSVPVHANRLKPFYDPADRPIEPLQPLDQTSPDLAESDLPPDSFAANASVLGAADDRVPHSASDVPAPPIEPAITRPEDFHTPQTIVGV